MRVCLSLIFFCVSSSIAIAEEASGHNDKVIATVNSRKITGRELQLNFFLKQLSVSAAAPTKDLLVEQLIDRELIGLDNVR